MRRRGCNGDTRGRGGVVLGSRDPGDYHGNASAPPAAARPRLETAIRRAPVLARRPALASAPLSLRSPVPARAFKFAILALATYRETRPMSTISTTSAQERLGLAESVPQAELARRFLYYMSLMRETEDRIERK